MNGRVQVILLAVLNFMFCMKIRGQPFDIRRIMGATVHSPAGECPSDSVREALRSTTHQEVIKELRILTQGRTSWNMFNLLSFQLSHANN